MSSFCFCVSQKEHSAQNNNYLDYIGLTVRLHSENIPAQPASSLLSTWCSRARLSQSRPLPQNLEDSKAVILIISTATLTFLSHSISSETTRCLVQFQHDPLPTNTQSLIALLLASMCKFSGKLKNMSIFVVAEEHSQLMEENWTPLWPPLSGYQAIHNLASAGVFLNSCLKGCWCFRRTRPNAKDGLQKML